MEFEKLISSLDAEARAQAAAALLRVLSGGAPERTPSLPASGPERGSRRSVDFPLSAPGAAGPPFDAERAGIDPLAAAGEFSSPASAVPGGTAAEAAGEAAQVETRPDPDAERRQRSLEAETAEELARLAERLAAVSERNRRTLGAGTETVPPYASASGSATGAAAGPGQPSAFSASRAAAAFSDAAAVPGETDTEAAPAIPGAAERGYFDAEAVSEFFRRDSRRYDSGFSD